VTAAYQHRSLVLSLAIASYALVFMTFVVFEVPGLGIAHLFYLPVAGLALTGGVRRGILAGAIAVALFSLGVNDEQGHAEGNDALRRLALMLGSSLRPEDEVARVGEDEFAVLTVLARNDEAAALAAKLEAVMARQESPITFGWAVYPADGENALSLYRAADERLYARKLVRGDHAARGLYPVGAYWRQLQTDSPR
jgi:GGDEF domain-containing protein